MNGSSLITLDMPVINEMNTIVGGGEAKLEQLEADRKTAGELSNLTDTEEIKPSPQLFVVSANTEAGVQTAADNLKKWLDSHKSTSATLNDLSYTLASRRTHHPYRFSVVATDSEELRAALSQVKTAKTKVASSVSIAFVFTGQGAQWPAMGRELIATSLVFRRSILKSDRILRDLECEWSLMAELVESGDQSHIGHSEVSQPSCTAIQIALVDLLEDLSIRPKSVVGHSSGEIAAAYAAGALTHEAAMEA